jgi:exonuclease III
MNTFSTDYFFCGVCGFDQNEVLPSRPYGGCAIFWRQSLAAKNALLDSGSRRVCAIRCTFDFGNILLVNAYMLFENDDASADEFRLQLSIIGNLIEQNGDCHIIVGGDLNVDFSRTWLHTGPLTEFCNENCLYPVVNHSASDVDYSYQLSMQRFQTIDHFIVSEQLYCESVSRVAVCYEVDNTSDHDPIHLQLSINAEHFNVCNIDSLCQELHGTKLRLNIYAHIQMHCAVS